MRAWLRRLLGVPPQPITTERVVHETTVFSTLFMRLVAPPSKDIWHGTRGRGYDGRLWGDWAWDPQPSLPPEVYLAIEHFTEQPPSAFGRKVEWLEDEFVPSVAA